MQVIESARLFITARGAFEPAEQNEALNLLWNIFKTENTYKIAI